MVTSKSAGIMSNVFVSSGSDVTLSVSAGGPGVGIVNTAVEISQIIELATGGPPTGAQLAGWEAYQQSGGSLAQIASAFIASTAFANAYNGGTPVNPNSPITTPITSALIDHAQGSHTSTQVNAWVGTGLPVVQVFQAFALGDQFATTSAAENAQPIFVYATGEQIVTLQGQTAAQFSKAAIVLDNAKTEILANASGSNDVDVTSAGTASQAIDMAMADASASQNGGMIPANTGVIDWFQFGGDTYIVEATNATSTPEMQNALTPSDTVVEVVGLLDLSGATLTGHILSL